MNVIRKKIVTTPVIVGHIDVDTCTFVQDVTFSVIGKANKRKIEKQFKTDDYTPTVIVKPTVEGVYELSVDQFLDYAVKIEDAETAIYDAESEAE